MLYKNAEIHNVEEMITNADGSVSFIRVPEAVYEKLISYLAEKQKNGLSEADFSRVKRALYASFIKMYDSTRLAGDFTHMIHDDMEPFSYGDAVRDVTLQDVQALFPQLFREEAYAMSVVDPIPQND